MTVHSNPSLSYNPGWDRPPVLVIASDELARRRAEAAIGDAGWRTAIVAADEVADRLSTQPAASAVWCEVGADGDTFDRLISEATAGHRFPTVVATPLSRFDAVVAAIGDNDVELLVDASPVDRATALALVTTAAGASAGVHDVAAEPSAARLRQLSDEVSRIAATLARLSTSPTPAPASVELPTDLASDVALPVSGEMVRSVIRARRLRARFFDADLFADPAWDMLLDLFQAEIAQHRVPVSSLCIAAAVPPTTALRWIKTMTDNGLFRRRADPHDGRRVFVELSPSASTAMRQYFSDVGAVAAA